MIEVAQDAAKSASQSINEVMEKIVCLEAEKIMSIQGKEAKRKIYYYIIQEFLPNHTRIFSNWIIK